MGSLGLPCMDSRGSLEWTVLPLGSDSTFDPGATNLVTWRKDLLLDTQSEYRTVSAGIFCPGTLAETETRLFRTALHTGAYRVVPAIPGKKSDIGRKKNTGQ